MFWPLLLLIVGLVAMVVGFVVVLACACDPAPPANVQWDWTLLWLLLPAGAIGVVAALIWLFVLFVRWLA